MQPIDPKQRIKTDIEKYVKEFPGVKNFHLSVKRNSSGHWNVRDSLLIRIWINKGVFNANDVASKLDDGYGFKETINKLTRGAFVVQYDIYEN